jgi:hypothetical protein
MRQQPGHFRTNTVLQDTAGFLQSGIAPMV